MVSCQKGPTHHAYAWQIGPFWQDTLDIAHPWVEIWDIFFSSKLDLCSIFDAAYLQIEFSIEHFWNIFLYFD